MDKGTASSGLVKSANGSASLTAAGVGRVVERSFVANGVIKPVSGESGDDVPV